MQRDCGDFGVGGKRQYVGKYARKVHSAKVSLFGAKSFSKHHRNIMKARLGPWNGDELCQAEFRGSGMNSTTALLYSGASVDCFN